MLPRHTKTFIPKHAPGLVKRVLMGAPNREPPEYSRNIIENIRTLVGTFSWGSLFGVPGKVPGLVE